MHFKRITSCSDALFEACWSIYCSNFPLNERRDLLEQKRVFNTFADKFFFLAIYDNANKIAGILTFWLFNGSVFLEHFAIDKSLHGKGLGSEALKNFMNGLSCKEVFESIVGNDKDCNKGIDINFQPLVLEIELPVSENSIKRKFFYERLGFFVNKHFHLQPRYHKDDQMIEMLILSYPRLISSSEYDFFYAQEQLIMPVF